MAALANQAKRVTFCAFLLLLVSFFQADLAGVSAQSKLDFLGRSTQAGEKTSPVNIPVLNRNLSRKSTTPAGTEPSSAHKGKKVQVVSAVVQSGLAGKNSSNSRVLNRFENRYSINRLNEKLKIQPDGPLRKNKKNDAIKTARLQRNRAKKPIALMSIDYQDLPFQDVINDIRSQLKINILVFWPALEQAGIERDTPVTLKLSNISAGKVLAAVLDYVAGGTGQTLAMEADRGVLEINLKENLGRKLEVRTYYVGDLLHQPSRGYSMTGGYGGGMGGMGSNGGMGTMGQMGTMGGRSGFGGSRGFGNQGTLGGQNRRGSQRSSNQRTRSNQSGY